MALIFPNVGINGELFGSKTVVRAATIGPGVLLTDFEAGDLLDGVILAERDVILIKDQASAVENGIYYVKASGTPQRAEFLPAGDNANSLWIWIQEGTVNASTAYICTSPVGTDVVGVNNLVWTEFDVVKTLSIGRGGTGTNSLAPGLRVIQTNAGATALETTTTPQLTQILDTNGNEEIIFTATLAAVNEFTIANNSTGLAPIFRASGEANIGITLSDSNANELLTLNPVAFATNNISIANNSTGLPPRISSEGEANIGIVIADSNANELLILDSVVGAVNQINISNNSTGLAPVIASEGEINVDLRFGTAGTGVFVFGSGSAATSAAIRLEDNAGGEYVGLTVPAILAGSYTLILPTTEGIAGQILQTDGNNPAQLSWATVPLIEHITILTQQAVANDINLTAISYFPWYATEYGIYGSRSVILWYSDVVDRNLTVQVYDVSGATALGSSTVIAPAAAGILTFVFNAPVGDALIALRIAKSAASGTSPNIFGCQIRFV